MPLVAHQQWSFSRGEPLSAMPLHVCTVCTMAEFAEFCPKNNIFPFDGSGTYPWKFFSCDLCNVGQTLPPLVGIGLRYLKI